jgi:surface protein
MFSHATLFNLNIERWDVSNVTKMEGMFDGAAAFNQDIGSWNVINVKGNEMIVCWCSFMQPTCFGGRKRRTNHYRYFYFQFFCSLYPIKMRRKLNWVAKSSPGVGDMVCRYLLPCSKKLYPQQQKHSIES